MILSPTVFPETCVWGVKPSKCRSEPQPHYRDLGNHSDILYMTVQMRLKTKHLHFVLISIAGRAFMRQIILFYHDNFCSNQRHVSFAFSTAFPQFIRSHFTGLLLTFPLSKSLGQAVCSPDTNKQSFPIPQKRFKNNNSGNMTGKTPVFCKP